MVVSAHVDFETYSELNIKEVGGFRYAEDPTTEPLIMAYSIGKQKVVGVDLTGDFDKVIRKLSPLFDHIHSGRPVAAHNAHFERAIWEKTELCRRFPIIPSPAQWDCTAARARMLALPGSLDGAASAVGLSVRKDPRGAELINIFSKPQKKKVRGETITWRILPEDDPENFKAFIEYCRRDVKVERKLDKILPPLTRQESRAFQVDYEINDRGMPVNLDLAARAEAFVEEYSETLVKRAEDISGCRPTQIEQTKIYLGSQGLPVSNLQYATVEKLLEKKDLKKKVRELLELRVELSRAGTKKLKALRITASPDGRIRGGFLFSAASTRRWASTGMQMHNLQKPEGETNPELVLRLLASDPNFLLDLFERPLTALAQSVRGFLEAKGDQVFHISDYASVEPRGLAWLSGEEWMLEAYRAKQDLYRITAGKVYHKDPDQLRKDGPERFMGKQLILGCGYGMGPPRFAQTVAKFGTVLTEAQAVEAVTGYRRSAKQIIKFWKTANDSCIRATKEWAPVYAGKLRFRPETLSNGFKVLFIDTPSGSIAYPDPSVGQEEWYGKERDNFQFYKVVSGNFFPESTFGGSIVESIVQGLTRDILRDGLIAASDAGVPSVGHVHDEGIAEGEEDEELMNYYEGLLKNSSPWAKGFPIEMESFMAKRYRK